MVVGITWRDFASMPLHASATRGMTNSLSQTGLVDQEVAGTLTFLISSPGTDGGCHQSEDR